MQLPKVKHRFVETAVSAPFSRTCLCNLVEAMQRRAESRASTAWLTGIKSKQD